VCVCVFDAAVESAVFVVRMCARACTDYLVPAASCMPGSPPPPPSRSRGITAPILPGIMPIMTYGGFKRMTAFCKTKVPQHIADTLEALKDNEDAIKVVVVVCVGGVWGGGGAERGTGECECAYLRGRDFLWAAYAYLPRYHEPAAHLPPHHWTPPQPPPDPPTHAQAYGISVGTMMCQRLLDAGVPGVHMYTLNLERSAVAILENVGLVGPSVAA
jgi:hypothetical protein